MKPIVRFRNVQKSFNSLTVLDGLDLDIYPGEKLAVIGSSGSGKSTFLRLLMALEPVNGGQIWVEDQLLWQMRRGDQLVPADARHLRKMRSKIGMVFQQFNLFPHMTVLQNICDPLIAVKKEPRAAARERAIDFLRMVGLEGKIDSYPSQLSGGQQQRVAIARALAMRPQIMLFDEVTSALDPELVAEVLNVMRSLSKEQDLTMIVVTHQMEFARDIADRVLFFDSGRIVEEGTAEEFFTAPQHPRTQLFLKSMYDSHVSPGEN